MGKIGRSVVPRASSASSGSNLVWSPPAQFSKLNFDGSKLTNGNVACRFVIRDSCGKFCLQVPKIWDLMFRFYRLKLGSF